MPKTVEFEDPTRLGLIKELRQMKKKENADVWRRLSEELSKSRKNRRTVNIWRINKHAREDETIIVPGKVLGTGDLNHRINVAAFKFTEYAKQKIEKSGSKILSISELIKKNPKGSNIRIIG